MNHTITIGGLLLGIGAAIGFVIAAFGLSFVAAASMADSDVDGLGKSGFRTLAIGSVLFGGCILGLLA